MHKLSVGFKKHDLYFDYFQTFHYFEDYGDSCTDPERRPRDDFETVPLGKCLRTANWWDYGEVQEWQWTSSKMDGDKSQGLIQYLYSVHHFS